MTLIKSFIIVRSNSGIGSNRGVGGGFGGNVGIGGDDSIRDSCWRKWKHEKYGGVCVFVQVVAAPV